VEPGAVFVGREIVNPPRENVSGDIYGSMLFFFLDVSNRERDKVLKDITKALAPVEAPEP
jgi:hypothetical protein